MNTEQLNRIFARAMYGIVIAAMVFSGAGGASAEGEPIFLRAFPDQNAVDGGNWPLGVTVHMVIDDPTTLTNPDYTQDADVTASDEGWISTYVRFDFDGVYDLKRGDEVTLEAGEISRHLVVPNVWITNLDVENNIVGGTFEGAEPGTTVHVFIGGGAQMYVTTDSEEAWVADFDEVGFDLLPGMQGAVEVWFDEFNDSTIFNWYIPNTRFTVFPEWEWFDAYDWAEGATVTVTIAGKPQCSFARQSPGDFFNGDFPEGCDVQIDDMVTFTDGETTRTHTVQNLAVTKANHDDNTIKGTANPGAEVYVWPHATGEQQLAIAKTNGAAQGKWTVDFSGIYDLTPGECGRSEIRDEFGNSTAVDWCISSPRIVASESGDWFWTTGFKPGDLNIFIYDSPDEGANLLWSGQGVADESGFAFVGFDIHGQDMLPGNYLVISDDDSQKGLVLQPISVTVFDTENEIMAGFAPAGSEVWAAAGPQEWQERIRAEADPITGAWFANFAEIGFDITEDMRGWSYAHIYDEDGDANEGSTPPPGATLVVIANQPDWVDSGITVSAGQSFTIKAFGLMNPCSDTYPNGAGYCIFFTPQGAEGVVPYENEFGIFPGPGLRFMALLGRIGDGEPFYVGAGGAFIVEESGTLWFTPNDNLRTDNQGTYIVLVWLEP